MTAGRRPGKWVWGGAVALALGSVFGVFVGTASAWFGSNIASGGTAAHACDTSVLSQCIANNRFHYVYMGGGLPANSDMRQPTIDAINVYNNGTASLSVVTTTDTTIMDVSVVEGNYGSTAWWAYGTCSLTATYGGTDPHRYCTRQIVVYNKTHPSNWDGTLTGRKAVACHEMGHTLGLRHTYSASCMINGTKTYVSANTTEFGELDSWYSPPGGP